jgi:putative nucleotide binding protein
MGSDKMEDYAVILDYLSLGYLDNNVSFKKKPIAQAIGTEDFTLLELIPKIDTDLEIQEKVYIGRDLEERDRVDRVKGKLDFENLTATSRVEIDYAIKEIILSNEKKYLDFFNTAGSLNTRLHKLELLPGIGNKHMWSIIEEREKEPFKNFEDIKKRVPLLPDPIASVVNRVKIEIDTTKERRGKNKYIIFTEPPKRKVDEKGRKRGSSRKRNNHERREN